MQAPGFFMALPFSFEVSSDHRDRDLSNEARDDAERDNFTDHLSFSFRCGVPSKEDACRKEQCKGEEQLNHKRTFARRTFHKDPFSWLELEGDRFWLEKNSSPFAHMIPIALHEPSNRQANVYSESSKRDTIAAMPGIAPNHSIDIVTSNRSCRRVLLVTLTCFFLH